jgi:MFS family permease
MQLGDSYCSELYDKIQSLYLKDLLMIPMDITLNEATVLLNSVAIPFYVIAALAPMSRVLVDYIGKKKVFLMSFCVLVMGVLICMTTDNWLLFLLGNSLVSFGCSVDIQYIYIVDEFESNKRGTVRGILAAVAALAGMGVAFVRKISANWL